MKEIKALFIEVLQSIVPLTLAVAVLQFTVIQMPLHAFLEFLVGAVMTAIGMVLFLLGARIGLLPMGKAVGSDLPRHGSLWLIVAVVFIIGFTVTVAEPNVLVLADQVDTMSQNAIPSNLLVYIIAIGAGVMVVVAVLRIILEISVKYILVGGYALVLLLSFFAPQQFVPMAFDAGGFSTGLMTIPFILATGLGLASVLSDSDKASDGFGVIGLSMLGPILAVMLMGVMLA
jgi:hypothetical protein